MKQTASPLSEYQQISILLDEYRVLYALLQWRLSASDRRLFVSAALLTGIMSAIHLLSPDTSRYLLWGLPVLLWVLFSATVGHARSKEDLLRRIDEIECRINALAGQDLLVFQSARPDPEKTIAGRTGRLAINGTLALCILVLLLGVLVSPASTGGDQLGVLLGYGIWAAFWALRMVHQAVALQHYRYDHPSLFRFGDSN